MQQIVHQQIRPKYNASGNGASNTSVVEVRAYDGVETEALAAALTELNQLGPPKSTQDGSFEFLNWTKQVEEIIENKYDGMEKSWGAFFDEQQYGWEGFVSRFTGGASADTTKTAAWATVEEDLSDFLAAVYDAAAGASADDTSLSELNELTSAQMTKFDVPIKVLASFDLKNDYWNFCPPCAWCEDAWHGIPKYLVYSFYLFLERQGNYDVFCKKAPSEVTSTSASTPPAASGPRNQSSTNDGSANNAPDVPFNKHSPKQQRSLLNEALCATFQAGAKEHTHRIVHVDETPQARAGKGRKRPSKDSATAVGKRLKALNAVRQSEVEAGADADTLLMFDKQRALLRKRLFSALERENDDACAATHTSAATHAISDDSDSD